MIILTLARKPCAEPSVAANVLKHGTGGINIDNTRIGERGASKRSEQAEYPKKPDGSENRSVSWARTGHQVLSLPMGRWPANLILCHLPECYKSGSVEVPGYQIDRWTDGAKPFGGGAGHKYAGITTSAERVEVWECKPGCPVQALDRQSGDTSSPWIGNPKGVGAKGGLMFGGSEQRVQTKLEYADTGGAARYFKQIHQPPEFIRTSGDCICPVCNQEYRKHPYDQGCLDWENRPFLHVLCDGIRVKL